MNEINVELQMKKDYERASNKRRFKAIQPYDY